MTELMNNRGYGCILGGDDCELYFDGNSLDGVDIRALSAGNWVEYQEQYWGRVFAPLKSGPLWDQGSDPLIVRERMPALGRKRA